MFSLIIIFSDYMSDSEPKWKPVYDPEGNEAIRELMENMSWFDNNFDKLAEKFDGQAVAVYKQRIVDSNPDLRTLGERLRKNYPPKEGRTIYVKFVTKEKYDVILKNF